MTQGRKKQKNNSRLEALLKEKSGYQGWKQVGTQTIPLYQEVTWYTQPFMISKAFCRDGVIAWRWQEFDGVFPVGREPSSHVSHMLEMFRLAGFRFTGIPSDLLKSRNN